MTSAARRIVGLVMVWLVLSAAGSAWIARQALAQRQAAFETDARIAHRLLSQRLVEHDAILATLALLQPGASAGETAPEQRLPSVYPQVLRVLRKDAGAAWPAEQAAALAAGEEASRKAGRAALAAVDFTAGRYTVVRAATPASFALVIDLAELVPKAEWPLPPSGPQRVVLEYGGQARVLSPGRIDTAEGWYYRFRKPLAADSQPFEISAEMRVGWTELPWGAMATWATALAAVMAAAHAWWRQRTERRRAQELLRLGQVGRLNALGELAAGMAHELNQPLTAVLASVDAAGRMLAEEQPDVEAARGAIGLASAQARRAAEVTGRLRRVVERPELAAHMQQVRLDDAARNALELLAPDCARLGVAPTLAVDASARTALADPVALEQITHNLLSNALHALEQVPAGERRLELSVAPDGPRSVLSVRDSGPGIAPEMLAHLFEPFFSSRPGGLGLGLSLCETLALGMGGALTGTNVAPHGAEFRLTLPRAPAPAA